MIQLANGLRIDVREATAADVPLLWRFFRSMAEFERLPYSGTEASIRAALFGDAPAARTAIASADGTAVAYVTYFFTFSTAMGRRGLWLEDLFVDPAFRGKGLGEALMAYVAAVAVRYACARLEWIVLDWNEPARRFYDRLGATPLDGWRMCRLDGPRLTALASRAPVMTAEDRDPRA